MNEVEVKLFGAFRKYVPSGSIKVQLPAQLTARQFKEIIKIELRQQNLNFKESLVDESALATESQVLDDNVFVTDRSNLALLPPVCGG